MKRVDLTRVDVDTKRLNQTRVNDSDAAILVSEDTIAYYNGEPVLIYMKIKEDTTSLRWAVTHLKYSQHKRTNGLKTSSLLFGYMPRNAIRRDYCSATAMARDYPKQHHIISKYSQEVDKLYKNTFPKVYDYHKSWLQENVRPEWRMADSIFTSGVVNYNNTLKYHFDSGNVPSTYNAMVTFKRGVQGGHLLVPEFNIKLECADNTVAIFNAEGLLHGVTPIHYKDKDSYRYTLVYYTLQQMCNCESIKEELKRIRKVKKDREHKRIHKGSDASDSAE